MRIVVERTALSQKKKTNEITDLSEAVSFISSSYFPWSNDSHSNICCDRLRTIKHYCNFSNTNLFNLFKNTTNDVGSVNINNLWIYRVFFFSAEVKFRCLVRMGPSSTYNDWSSSYTGTKLRTKSGIGKFMPSRHRHNGRSLLIVGHCFVSYWHLNLCFEVDIFSNYCWKVEIIHGPCGGLCHPGVSFNQGKKFIL